MSNAKKSSGFCWLCVLLSPLVAATQVQLLEKIGASVEQMRGDDALLFLFPLAMLVMFGLFMLTIIVLAVPFSVIGGETPSGQVNVYHVLHGIVLVALCFHAMFVTQVGTWTWAWPYIWPYIEYALAWPK